MPIERIISPVTVTPEGSSFSALEVGGDGFDLVNAAEERDSTGQVYPAGSQSVISVRHDTGSTINASYIKTGVIDANLMRAGLIQTVPSWNTKWYGAPEDHAAVQMGFTGGSIAATAVSTGSGTVSLTLPAGHGLTTGDYIRVSGLYFTTGVLLGSVGLNLPTNGPLNYASATVSSNTLTYSKADITSGLTASTASTVYVGKALAISSISRVFDDPDNPAELSTVTVTTSAAHGFSVGDYIELTGTIQTIDGVAYVTTVPTSTTFTFKQRFGDNLEYDGTSTGISLPTLGAPAAIKVLKSYTQNADGSIHITSGTVDAGLIVGTISANDITVGSGSTVARVGSYPNTTSPTFQGFWAGDSNPSSAEFSVNTAGVLSATGATISGALTATTLTATGSGSIGGWTISSTSLKAGSSGTTVGLDSGGTNPAIYAGSATPSSAPFRVTNAGAVTATSGSIGGWTLGSTSLTAGSAGTTVGVDSGGTNPAFYAGSATPGSAPFRVTNAGALTATSGIVGGWTLGSTSLKAGSGSTTVGIDSGGTNPAIYAGSATPASAPFRVTNAGALTATSGAVGGWTLGSSSLTSGSGSTTVGLDSGGTNPAIYAGSSTAASAPFRVSNTGAVTATNLTVTGGSISIGNFLLSTSGNITDKLVIQQKFITNENGVDLISTSSTGGSSYALSKSVSDGIYTGIQNGSFGATPPTLSSNINNSTNALPYWTYSDGGSANKPYAQVVTSTSAASGYVLRFTIPASAAVGDYAYIERYVAVPGSYARSYTYQPRAAWSNRSASDTSILVYQDAQYFTNATSSGVPTTKTGTQGPKHVVVTAVVNNTTTLQYTYTADTNNTIVAGDRIFVRGSSLSQYNIGAPDSPVTVDSATSTTFTVTQSVAAGSATFTNGFARIYPGSKLLSDLSSTWGTETWSDPGSLLMANGAVPENGAYLRIRVGVLVGTTVGGTARTVDLSEVRIDRGPIQLQLVDQTSPDTYGYGNVWLSSGLLTIAPNQSGTNGGSSGTQNPRMEFASSDGKIYIKPSSTGSVIIQSKTTGGSAAAVPLQVQGITSQTGNLQQWLNVGGTVLASVASDGSANFPNVTSAGDITANNLYGTTAMWSPYLISEAGLSSTLNLRASSGQVLIQDSNVANGTNPRLAFYDKSGTAYATVKSGGVGIVQILSGISTTTYGQLWASRIYPMNGSTASRYIYDDGTNTRFTGPIYGNSTVYGATGVQSGTTLTSGANILCGGVILDDTPTGTTATTNAAIWVLISGTNYELRRNTSSARYKTNIVDADEAVLEAAKKIKPRHYESTIPEEAGTTRLGFIAEEVEAAGLTHAVGYDGEGRVDTIDPTALIAALYARVNDLEIRLAELETGA